MQYIGIGYALHPVIILSVKHLFASKLGDFRYDVKVGWTFLESHSNHIFNEIGLIWTDVVAPLVISQNTLLS